MSDRVMDGFAIEASSPKRAIRIHDHIWWVGRYLPDDPFQCHTYLIEDGEESILMDPGSILTFPDVLRKVEEVIPFAWVKYFICQHQDPDITGSLPIIDRIIDRKDAVILTHSRAIALLRHYGLKLPFQCVERLGWKLRTANRLLKFIFTPYLHFPGAFCSFDPQSRILFSSDLFGGFTEGWSLVAKDESYFESMRPFHEHYMPAREILFHGLSKLEEYPIRMIAPQHGSIIPQDLVKFMINRLKNTDCGVYLMTQSNSDVLRLSCLNKMLSNFMQSLVSNRDFGSIAKSLLEHTREILPADGLEFYATAQESATLHFSSQSMFRGVVTRLPDEYLPIMGLDRLQVRNRYGRDYFMMPEHAESTDDSDPSSGAVLVIPLYATEHQIVHGLALLHLNKDISIDEETTQMLKHLSVPLNVAVEREVIHRTLDMERQAFYNQAIRDPLTGLYTRLYMQEMIKRLFSIHDRDSNSMVSVAIFDIDHFKAVNDTHGHNVGDEVLKRVAETILEQTRTGDIQVRLGGEEFAVFTVNTDGEQCGTIAERVRKTVELMDLSDVVDGLSVTVSCGISQRNPLETSLNLISRADKALYEAKNNGRNKVCVAVNH